jgi:hypothetical protein
MSEWGHSPSCDYAPSPSRPPQLATGGPLIGRPPAFADSSSMLDVVQR